jgi:AmmeMemoRadiSam system protein A
MQLTPEHQHAILDLARSAIRAALAGAAPPAVPDEPALRQPAGVFVSLHQSGTHRLRGCVGRLDAKVPLGQAVVTMAASVLEDPRFLDDPVTPGELPSLDIELSILSPLMPAEHPLDFDLSEGIYLTHGDRCGCFLPQVARETGWDKEQLLNRLCTEKMGLPAIAWKHPATRLQRFTTWVIGPEPFVTHHVST